MIYLYKWWHRRILKHRVSGPYVSMDMSGRFDVYKCSCRKSWVK